MEPIEEMFDQLPQFGQSIESQKATANSCQSPNSTENVNETIGESFSIGRGPPPGIKSQVKEEETEEGGIIISSRCHIRKPERRPPAALPKQEEQKKPSEASASASASDEDFARYLKELSVQAPEDPWHKQPVQPYTEYEQMMAEDIEDKV